MYVGLVVGWGDNRRHVVWNRWCMCIGRWWWWGVGLGCSAVVECGDHKEEVRENGCVGFGMNEWMKKKERLKRGEWRIPSVAIGGIGTDGSVTCKAFSFIYL